MIRILFEFLKALLLIYKPADASPSACTRILPAYGRWWAASSQNFEIAAVQKCAHLAELEKCCQLKRIFSCKISF